MGSIVRQMDLRLTFRLTVGSPEVEVEYWYADEYEETKVVPVEDIVCQVARARYDNPPIWMTVSLEKVHYTYVMLSSYAHSSLCSITYIVDPMYD